MYIKNSEYFSKFTGAEIDFAVENNLDIDEKLARKVDKTQKVNGKALTGNITLNATDVGAQPVITSVNMLSSNLVDDSESANKFVNTELITQIGVNSTNIQRINSKIPEEASSVNKLTDEAFVNELVDEINDKIPSEASSSNKLADKAYVSNSVSALSSIVSENTENIASNTTSIASNTSNISSINSKIPSEASSSNKLADKAYVTTLVSTTIGNGTVTITQGGVNKGTFTLNQKTNTTIALESGGGGGSASSMADLADVSLDNLANGQTLVYNSDVQKWENSNSSGSSVSTLADVSLDNLTNGQTLVYNANDNLWENGDSASSLSTLTDVSLSSLSNGEALIYNADDNTWENGSVASSVNNLSDVSLSNLANGQVLTYDSTQQKWKNNNKTSVIFVDWTS